jgi:hypothetical protein
MRQKLAERCETYEAELGKLARERVRLQKRIDEIDLAMYGFEGCSAAADMARKDWDVHEAVEAAKRQAEVEKTDNDSADGNEP